MSARVTVSQTTQTTAPPAAPSDTGRLFIIGRAATGPTEPTSIKGIAQFIDTFGARIGANPDLYDTLADAFRWGLAEAVVVRAVGAAAAAATVTLGGSLTVTAKYVGAYANGWTAAYTSSTKTLTVVAAGVTETYVGTDLASLLEAATASSTVTVTGSALPGSNVTATNLAGGADDFASANYTTLLTAFTKDLGPAAVAIAGANSDTVGAALALHAQTCNRLALLTTAATTVASAVSAASTAAALPGASEAVLLWPDITVNGVTRKPLGFVAGRRATAIGSSSAGQSLIARRYGVSGVKPAVRTTDADFATLNAGRVSAIREVGGKGQVDVWLRLTDVTGDAAGTLSGAEKADLVHEIAARLDAVGEAYVGRIIPNASQALASWAGDLRGALQAYASDGLLFATDDGPGFAVNTASVNTPASLAAGDLKAVVGVKLSPTAQFVYIDLAVTDAAGTL